MAAATVLGVLAHRHALQEVFSNPDTLARLNDVKASEEVLTLQVYVGSLRFSLLDGRTFFSFCFRFHTISSVLTD